MGGDVGCLESRGCEAEFTDFSQSHHRDHERGSCPVDQSSMRLKYLSGSSFGLRLGRLCRWSRPAKQLIRSPRKSLHLHGVRELH